MKAFTVCLLGKGDPDSPMPFKELFNGVLTVIDTDAKEVWENTLLVSGASYFACAISSAINAYRLQLRINSNVGDPEEDIISFIVTEMK